MKIKKYKIQKSGYKEIYDYEIDLPMDMKLLYKDGSVGECLHRGFNHYIGCLVKSYYPEYYIKYLKDSHLILNTYDFGDLLFIVFNNIKFVGEEPGYYTAEEFMKTFELDKYYIEFRHKDDFDYDKFKVVIGNTEEFAKQDNIINDIKNCYIKGKTYSICRITSIEGPYDITLFSVSNYSPFSPETEMYMISEERDVKISYICDSLNMNKSIYKDDPSKFNEMINKVLSRNI